MPNPIRAGQSTRSCYLAEVIDCSDVCAVAAQPTQVSHRAAGPVADARTPKKCLAGAGILTGICIGVTSYLALGVDSNRNGCVLSRHVDRDKSAGRKVGRS